MVPLLVSIPHCSGEVPDLVLRKMLGTGEPEADLRRRLLSEGDPFTDSIFALEEAVAVVKAPWSRFVADLNRRRDEAGDNGVIKKTDFQLRPFYPPDYELSSGEREWRLEQCWDVYHGAIEKVIKSGGVRFLIDGHSMTAQGPSLGPDRGKARPALCIGNQGDSEGEPVGGPVSCPPETARRIRDFLQVRLAGLFAKPGTPQGVRLNNPFDGGNILLRYSQPPFSVPGVMIEVNRAVYLDEAALQPLPGRIEALRAAFADLAREIFRPQ